MNINCVKHPLQKLSRTALIKNAFTYAIKEKITTRLNVSVSI